MEVVHGNAFHEDYKNLGMTDMKVSIRFWRETGRHFSTGCPKMFLQNLLCVMRPPYDPIAEEYFCMNLASAKKSKPLKFMHSLQVTTNRTANDSA